MPYQMIKKKMIWPVCGFVKIITEKCGADSFVTCQFQEIQNTSAKLTCEPLSKHVDWKSSHLMFQSSWCFHYSLRSFSV